MSITALLEELITIPSTPDDSRALDVILQRVLNELNGYTVERFEKDGVKSALVYNKQKRPESFKVILNAHLDIIPAKKEQFIPKIVGDKLYGAGSMDMKGGAVCLIDAFKKVADTVNYPLALQLTTDEEVGGFKGTKHQIEKGVRANFILAGEPTNFEIVHKAKGILQVKIRARGVTAHGAYPWLGNNAVMKLHDFLNRLQRVFPAPKGEQWQTTVNVSALQTTNEAYNKVPDDATLQLDVRFVAEDGATVKQKIESLLPEGCEMETVFFESAMQTAQDNPFIVRLMAHTKKITGKEVILRGANGSSDARHYASVGGAGIEFGPVGEGIGSDVEWVSIASLERYSRLMQDFLLDPTIKNL